MALASRHRMPPVRVWAPAASRVEVIARDRVDAVREADGWWRGPSLADGDPYLISLDGEAPLPDPRSRWQPEGVAGESRWLEPRPAPPLARPAPALHDALIYELHVGTYTLDGTFAAAARRLDHLVDLGVTHVE